MIRNVADKGNLRPSLPPPCRYITHLPHHGCSVVNMFLQDPALLLPLLCLALGAASTTASQLPNADSCYGSSLPHIAPSTEHRPVPWGTPSVHFSSLNGTLTTCCDSLTEVRTALDAIDDQILDLLNQRQMLLTMTETLYVLTFLQSRVRTRSNAFQVHPGVSQRALSEPGGCREG